MGGRYDREVLRSTPDERDREADCKHPEKENPSRLLEKKGMGAPFFAGCPISVKNLAAIADISSVSRAARRRLIFSEPIRRCVRARLRTCSASSLVIATIAVAWRQRSRAASAATNRTRLREIRAQIWSSFISKRTRGFVLEHGNADCGRQVLPWLRLVPRRSY
jgi:hypothetical protein